MKDCYNKDLYDHVFYQKKSKLMQAILILFLFIAGVAFILTRENTVMTYYICFAILVSLIGLLVFTFYLRFSKNRIMVGINKEGVFSRGVGWIYWDEIKSMEVNKVKTKYHNFNTISFLLYDPQPFYERMGRLKRFVYTIFGMYIGCEPNRILFISKNGIDISLENILRLLKVYYAEALKKNR